MLHEERPLLTAPTSRTISANEYTLAVALGTEHLPLNGVAMNKREAIQVLQRKLEEYRALSYEQLSLRIDQKDHHEVVGESGVRYQIELEFLWDDKPNKNIRVFGMIDDSGWRAWMPLVQCFIRAPDESLIGE